MSDKALLKQIYAPVTAEFERVDQYIGEQLSSEVPLVDKIGRYIVSAGGKRLRPLLVLLAAKACGYSGKEDVQLAAVIEFLHTATLLHDDVVDTSDLRRGRATANAKWGNAPSVLVGDYLYSRSFQMLVGLRNFEIMDILANATRVIAEGEVLQLMKVRDASCTEETYMQVIRSKTAMLFEASTQSAGIISGASDEQCDALRRYGDHLGVAFQLIDDILDYQGNAEDMGKNIGDDLAEGKPTLPLIFTMREGTPEQAQLVRKAIQKGDSSDMAAISKAVQDSGGLDYTQELAERHIDQAINCLQLLPDSPSREAMVTLANFSISRNH